MGSLTDRFLSSLDATLAAPGDGFIRAWTRVERSYKRPFLRFSAWLKFAFFPLLALGALAWLAWDWSHAQSVNLAETARSHRRAQIRKDVGLRSARVSRGV